MSEEIDLFIDSFNFTDRKLLAMIKSGKKLSSLTLVRYLSRGIVIPCSQHNAKAEVIRELLHAGAPPFCFSQRGQWDVLFAGDVRSHMPVALRSTINLAALARNKAIMNLLIQAGEEPNNFTAEFLKAI